MTVADRYVFGIAGYEMISLRNPGIEAVRDLGPGIGSFLRSWHALAAVDMSLGVAIALVAAGSVLILARPDWVGRVAGGPMVGIAIVAMHYTGMSAYEVQGHLIWDWQTVAASIMSGVGLAALSVVLPLD